MNLESVEQCCFLVLSEAENPLVPLNVLLAHVREDPECADIETNELLAFLRNHALFSVLEPMTLPATGELIDPVTGLSNSPSPRVILKTRIPTPSDLAEQMTEELNVLAAALERALEEYERSGSEPDLGRTRELLDRVQALQRKLAGADNRPLGR